MKLPLLLLIAAGAAAGTGRADEVTIHVANPSSRAVTVTACGPVGCTGAQEIPGRGSGTFVVAPGRGSRAVVTAMRGSRRVAQHPVDFRAGDVIEIALEVRE
jgi:hypothetical protein